MCGLRFNVSQLIKELSGSTRNLEVVGEVLSPNGGSVSLVTGGATLMRTDMGVWVSARLSTREKSICSRCLEEFRMMINTSIEEEAIPVARLVDSDHREVVEEDLSRLWIDPEQILDITEVVRQYIDLAIPMKPICNDNCLGICSTCGINLNKASCSCEKVMTASQWAPLLDLINTGELGKGLKN